MFWTGAILYWIALCVMTHLPPGQVHIPRVFTDKQIHFAAYMMLSLVLGGAMMVTLPGRRWVPLYVIAVAMAYGAVDERTQLFVGRECELGDWIADVSGASAAAVVLFVAQFFLKSRQVPVGRQLIAGFEGVIPPSAAAADAT
jgi:VanZ family protein